MMLSNAEWRCKVLYRGSGTMDMSLWMVMFFQLQWTDTGGDGYGRKSIGICGDLEAKCR